MAHLRKMIIQEKEEGEDESKLASLKLKEKSSYFGIS